MGNIPDDLLREFMEVRRSSRPSVVPLIAFVATPMLVCLAGITFLMDIERLAYAFVGAAAFILVFGFFSIGE